MQVPGLRLAIAAAAVIGLSPSMAQTPPGDPVVTTPRTVQATIRADQPGAQINRRVFGQFAEHLGTGIYGGVWVGPDSKIPNTRGYRNDVVAALKAISVPVVRWPGGCFADEYNWREGIGPRNQRPVKINTHWGGVTEPNSFGTHEFMDFAELIGAEAYVSGNVGNGTPREMAEWVEYMTSPAGSLADLRAKNGRAKPWKVPLFGIGNELWGCGGNMRPEYAADLTRRYGTFIKVPQGTKIEKIASGANVDDYNWTEVLMRETARRIDGIGLHYYTRPYSRVPGTTGPYKRGSATDFTDEEYARTLFQAVRMEELISKHSAIMDKYDPEKRVNLAVDEWGNWFDAEPGTVPGFLYQQSTLRDAITASLTFDIFFKHADRVRMTNIAQMVNVLQALILTDGAKMVLTPTYHVYAMYKPFQDATRLPIEMKGPWYNEGQWTVPAISATAARDTAGVVHVAMTNVDPNRPATISVTLQGVQASSARGQILTAPTLRSLNTFTAPNVVAPTEFNGARVSGGTLSVTLPPRSVVVVALQ